MASREINVHIELTGYPAFRRLVAFVEDIEALADERTDVALQGMVYGLREDLICIMEEKG